MDKNRILGARGLVLPHEIDKVLGREDEFPTESGHGRIQRRSISPADHAGVDTDTSALLHAGKEERLPVLEAVNERSTNEVPVAIELVLGLKPIAGVCDEICTVLRNDGLPSRAGETTRGDEVNGVACG